MLSIFDTSGPVDLRIAMSTTDMDTFIPVAQGPSAKALTTKSGSRPSWWCIATWSACFTSASSAGPRTQLFGAPLVPDDSSTTTPSGGMRPPRQRSSIV